MLSFSLSSISISQLSGVDRGGDR